MAAVQHGPPVAPHASHVRAPPIIAAAAHTTLVPVQAPAPPLLQQG
jgi:hypothetical protein